MNFSTFAERKKKFHYSRETRKAQTNAPALTILLIFPSLMFPTSSHMCYSGKSWWWSKAIRSKQPFRFREFSRVKALSPLLFLPFFSFFWNCQASRLPTLISQRLSPLGTNWNSMLDYCFSSISKFYWKTSAKYKKIPLYFYANNYKIYWSSIITHL